MPALTREQGINHITYEMVADHQHVEHLAGMAEHQIWDFYQPQAEALYDILTSTTPQQRFPQHGANLIRINANHNQVTKTFLDRQYKLWAARQWIAGPLGAPQ